jgi:hypothetical protein
MKRLIFILLLSSTWVHSAPLELRVVGNKVRDAHDCLIRLKGANIASLEWSNQGEGPTGAGAYPITATVNEVLTNWGANIIRIPMSQDRWFGYGRWQTDGGAVYRTIVDLIVERASNANAYVLLDLHWSNLGEWGTANAQHVMPDMNAVAFWTDVATRYANNPAVLFDLYNEPYGVSWSSWRDGGTVTENSGAVTFVTPGMQGLLDAVRATGARNVVVAGGLDWAFDLRGIQPGYGGRPNGWALSDTTGNGVIYATHIYPWKPSNWDTYVSVIANSYPILVGEVGQYPDELFSGGIETILNWMDSRGYHWTGWDIHPGACPCMITDWLFTPSTHFGAAMKARLLATSTGQGCPSPTPTFSPTATATATPTPTGTWYTPTVTPTPTATPENGVEGILPYPNPAVDGTVRFWVNFDKPASELRIRAYTTSSRLVMNRVLTDVSSGEYEIELRDERGGRLANGVYYLVFTTKTRERKCKLMILR